MFVNSLNLLGEHKMNVLLIRCGKLTWMQEMKRATPVPRLQQHSKNGWCNVAENLSTVRSYTSFISAGRRPYRVEETFMRTDNQ
jgi:hypothetical protein